VSDQERDDFRWRDNECVVIPEQPATAVYCSDAGYVVIRQEGSYPLEDMSVILTPESAVRVANALVAQAETAAHLSCGSEPAT